MLPKRSLGSFTDLMSGGRSFDERCKAFQQLFNPADFCNL